MDTKKLVTMLADKLGRSTQDIDKLLDAFSSVVADRCGELDSIAIPGFGSFEAKKKQERVVVTPGHGNLMLGPPTLPISFNTRNVLKNILK